MTGACCRPLKKTPTRIHTRLFSVNRLVNRRLSSLDRLAEWSGADCERILPPFRGDRLGKNQEKTFLQLMAMSIISPDSPHIIFETPLKKI